VIAAAGEVRHEGHPAGVVFIRRVIQAGCRTTPTVSRT
jgi:hypothetical protein